MKRSAMALGAAVLTIAIAFFSSKACSVNQATVTASQAASASASSTPEPDVILRITRGGQVLKAWSLASLKAAVPFTQITLDGEAENGPLLEDVLKASGVTDWTSGTAIGSGPTLAFSVSLPLNARDVDETWILSVNNRNLLKLAARSLSRDSWVRDVSEIQVK